MQATNAFLSPVLEWVWRSSGQVVVLVVLVLGVQRFLGYRLLARWRYSLWFLVLARLLVPVAPTITFAAADFSAINNPNGAWSYGWMPRTKLEFNLYTKSDTLFGLIEWTGDFPPDFFTPESRAPHLSFNPTTDQVEVGNRPLEPRRLTAHPSPIGQRNVIRWKAPRSGSIEIIAAFEGNDLDGTTTDASVYHNGSRLFAGDVEGFGKPSRVSFCTNITVTAGDAVDFVEGYGSNHTYTRDTTRVDATILELTGVIIF
ncbi:MAG: hypothetical protein M1608_17520 [Candidatus Omnitrophica bacterium]|nr:hypothetical protein [Candidatus Omnitrophota bacterium]